MNPIDRLVEQSHRGIDGLVLERAQALQKAMVEAKEQGVHVLLTQKDRDGVPTLIVNIVEANGK